MTVAPVQAWPSDLGEFRAAVREWCREHVPAGWRQAQTGAPDEEFVRFQQWWFAELRAAGLAVPHWPGEWGGGMSTARQIVLYSELAAHDAPRLVLAFVAIHHTAATLLAAGTDEQRRRHLPAILDGEIWAQGFSEPEAGSDLASLKTTARKDGERYVVNGQKLWASGAMHADWCLLLARTDPGAPKRRGISYFLLDMRTPGIEVRPIRQATGESHFCEIFLNDVAIPASQLVGAENAGWQVAQQTLAAERGMTMLELAERLGNRGLAWLVQACARTGPHGRRLVDDSLVADRLAGFETEVTGLRALCRRLVERHDPDASGGRGGVVPPGINTVTAGPADASIVKLYYSELLQRMTDFGAEITGLPAHAELRKPASSGWESGAWVLDFIGSWEWTIPGGTSEIQRTIIGERGLGLPREPTVP
jgi:alkylation response protein AidB-like acyl-CoA dehydrogenase